MSSPSFVPAGEAPEGTTSTYENPDLSMYNATLATAIVCTVVVDSVFLLHLYIKLLVKRTRFQLEDWFCVLAWILTAALTTNSIVDSHYGGGKDKWTISQDDYRNLLKAVYVSSNIYSPAAFCTKVALLLLIARVFSVHPTLSKAIRIFIAILAISYIPLQVMKMLVCRPIFAYWEAPEHPGIKRNCFDQTKLFLGDCAVSIVTDFIIFLIPIPLAWKMEAPRKEKIKIVLMLGAGGVATSATFLRAYQTIRFQNSQNASKGLAAITMTAVIEVSIGVICACLPSINLIFDKISHRRHRSHQRRWPIPLPIHRAALCSSTREVDLAKPQSKNTTVSSHWYSIKPILSMRTTTTTTTYTATTMPPPRPHSNRSSSRSVCEPKMTTISNTITTTTITTPPLALVDPPAPACYSPVFNNRLDLPSIRSTSDGRSCSSRLRDHRGLSDDDFAEQFEDRVSLKSLAYSVDDDDDGDGEEESSTCTWRAERVVVEEVEIGSRRASADSVHRV